MSFLNNLNTAINTVIVGQKMNLVCKTVTTNGPTLNNFQWTVPGFAISNYVVAADGSSAMVVTNFATNNANVIFYWVDGASNRVVQVSTTVNGVKLTTKATFNVIRPNVSWAGFNYGTVAADTNYNQSGTWLHFGNPSTTPGLTFILTASIGDWSLGTYSEIQLINSNQVIHCQTNGQSIHQSAAGLDGALGSTNFGDSFYHYKLYFDSPAEPCRSSDLQVSDSSSYQTLLMFQPSGGIRVPLKLIGWNWAGLATINTNENWALIPGSGNAPAPSPNNTDATQFPVWTNIVGSWPNGYNFITNNDCE
ncbi:MAG TPA: hypothetical protein VK742_04200 [Candidatus Sulfotelmatobacter sp.]|nr:hypothetical protein [Candidatus Sulfotelmatobacter sp.]